MSSRPDFSPMMLSLFLRARAVHAVETHDHPARRATALASLRKSLRKLARVTNAEFDMAWMGRLQRPEPRARLWAVLGHFPSDFGIVLTQGGQEGGR